jgi:hypothetical protein
MYLASICNSTIIETYVDIIRVSHGFDGCQMLEYIAAICNLKQENSYHSLRMKGRRIDMKSACLSDFI